MGRKAKATSPSPSSDCEDLDLAKKIDELSLTIATFTTRFDKLEKILADTKAENTSLKVDLKDKDSEICSLKHKLNEVEQYQRSWSIRVLNIPIPEDEASDNTKVMAHLFTKVLVPILKGAMERELLTSVPPVEKLLETAHILPSKSEKCPPIIARFYTRNIRSLIFQLKKDFAPRLPPQKQQPRVAQPGTKVSLGKFAFPIYEDLTRANFSMMRELSDHEDVLSCWSVAGSLRFRLKNETVVRKVKSVFDSVESILRKK